jgi:hypothetical protein
MNSYRIFIDKIFSSASSHGIEATSFLLMYSWDGTE